MKENFIELLEQLQPIGIVRVCSDFYMPPNHKYFVKSPATSDKHHSMRLYPATNTFCDFANGRIGGDMIRFVSYVRQVDNWVAAGELKEFYGVADSKELAKDNIRQRIQREQAEQRKKQERKHEFKQSLLGEIDALKALIYKYRLVLLKGQIEPFSDLWTYIINEIQYMNYKLDILCCVPNKEYVRMKPNSILGFPSDRPEWLLDTLEILKNSGAFKATGNEVQELKKQAFFENADREPGKDRGCDIDW